MNFSKSLRWPEMGLQIAPMVDLMFQLLTFFMAASFYAQWETKVGITVPTADTGVSGARQPGEIIVNLDEGGDIYVNNVQMEPDRLASLLKQVAETFRDQPVIIRADGKTRHEKVITVLDICKASDIWNVAFATMPPKKGP